MEFYRYTRKQCWPNAIKLFQKSEDRRMGSDD